VNTLMRRRLTPILLATVLALAGAAPAAGSTRSDIISDCSDDGQLQGDYKPSELRDARKHLPSDVAEYTDCSDVLRRAELPDGGSSGGGGGGGTGTPTTPAAPGATGGAVPPVSAGTGGVTTTPLTPDTEADRKALVDARKSSGQPVTAGGQKLLPSASGLSDGYRSTGLPGSLVVALILLGLAGLALSLPPVRRALPFWRTPAA